jgi:nitrogen-specific signal transduction histidine kinase
MNTIESLNIRTIAARTRLTELERRLDKSTTTGPVVKPALKELSAAIEELQVANEQLSQHVTELAASRHDAAAMNARHGEFIDLVPLPCVWTDEQGAVHEANEATAALLNVAARRLAGKPLSLFVSDRPAFFDALGLLLSGRSQAVEIAVLVRPRERRPRHMRMTGHRLRHDQRLCWILRDDSSAVPAPDPVSDPTPPLD